MTYLKKRVPQIYKYYINYIELARVLHIKDLGICFDSSLSFIDHYSLQIILNVRFCKENMFGFQ